jgi:8-oxo-dGTP pyrophosphatase MutT (NUDIX family)
MSEAAPRRIRRAARVLVVDSEERLLLFRFTIDPSPPFWALPGGECDAGEDYLEAARRELFEETGIVAEPHPLDYSRQDEFIVLLGEPVTSIEHFFHIRTEVTRIDTSRHTELERTIMQEHRWFTQAEIASWHETIYPRELAVLVDRLRDP